MCAIILNSIYRRFLRSSLKCAQVPPAQLPHPECGAPCNDNLHAIRASISVTGRSEAIVARAALSVTSQGGRINQLINIPTLSGISERRFLEE
jgi:hypothetical protein